jgi:hypothetical protein
MANKLYVKPSSIPGIGDGLFAKKSFKSGSVIIQLDGVLRGPEDPPKNSKTVIRFIDGSTLECPNDGLITFANDVIKFPGTSRNLLEALESSEPFYDKHCEINAIIDLNNENHTAMLLATRNIKPNEEIFIHYGFQYWFEYELLNDGFLKDEDDEKFPSEIFNYPAFLAYVRTFYPKMTSVDTYRDTDEDIVVISLGRETIEMPMRDYSKLMQPDEPN